MRACRIDAHLSAAAPFWRICGRSLDTEEIAREGFGDGSSAREGLREERANRRGRAVAIAVVDYSWGVGEGAEVE